MNYLSNEVSARLRFGITFHGKRGKVRKHYREGQEDQLSALGLVVNVVVSQ